MVETTVNFVPAASTPPPLTQTTVTMNAQDVPRQPRRPKTSRISAHSPEKSAQPTRSDVVSPRRASSLLTGSVNFLASGRVNQEIEKDNQSDESLAEVTVSLSKSSFLSSNSSKSNPDNNIKRRNDNGDESSQAGSSTNSYAQFLDSCENHQPLGISPRQGDNVYLPDPSQSSGHDRDHDSRQSNKSKTIEHPGVLAVEEPLDDFLTAYTSPGDLKMDFDDLIAPKPIKFTKAKVKIQRPNMENPETLERLRMAKQEQSYWGGVVNNRSVTLGTLHRHTAEAFLSLGHAHMRMNNYSEAISSFQSSCKIFKSLDGPTHLSVGRALDAFGLAALRYKQGGATYLIQAKTALEEAFAIRFHSLGVWHVDTVETFNKIASVYLHMGRLEEASLAYKEVFLVRKAIYGVNHPSVAISAHGLANVYLRMKQPEQSLLYFEVALGVYRSMHLPKGHPTVARLLNDRKRLRQQFREYFRSTGSLKESATGSGR